MSVWATSMRLGLALALIAPAWGAHAAERDASARARLNYMQYCAGCHLADGSGAPDKGIPSMRDGVLGHFLQSPAGRAYLLQVPGVTNTPLDNANTAQLMNWLVKQFADDGRTVQAFDAQEVAQGRAHRLSDPARTRAELLAR